MKGIRCSQLGCCMLLLLALLLMAGIVFAKENESTADYAADEDLYETEELIIIGDDTYTAPIQHYSDYPVITSAGRKNVRVNGIISKHKLLEYTIPDELLLADADFAALMLEAEKYIGYPYVYGASNPKEGFDCSGFVSWVFIHSGVYNTGRRGATGLHSLCIDVDPEDVLPGDLVFFHGTMGPGVDGITHVGIYVGNHMMIHAGDPVGFADLEDEKWQKRLDCYGRLPYRKETE